MSPRLRAVIGRYLIAPVSPSKLGCTSPLTADAATTSPGRFSPLRVTEPARTDAGKRTVHIPRAVRPIFEDAERFNDEGGSPYEEGVEW